MPTYEITDKDGATYEITVPDVPAASPAQGTPAGAAAPTQPPPVPDATQGAPGPLQALAGFFRGEQKPSETPGVAPQDLASRASRQALQTTPGRLAVTAASGVVGAPGDIINAPGAISALVGGPDFRLPIGSDDVAKAMGVDPSSMSGLERILQTTAGSVSPGLFLQAAGKAGILPHVAQRLYRVLSAGPVGDVAMGTASGVGGEIGRQATPGSPIGPIVGGIAGAGIASGIHGATSKAIQTVGAPTVARKDVKTAEQALDAALQPAQQVLNDSVLQPRHGGTIAGTRQAGEAARADVQALGARANTRAQAEGAKLVEGVGQTLDRMQTLATAKNFFQKEFFEKGRQSLGKLFDATEQVTGDAPVVNVTRFREGATRVAAESAATGQAVPRGTGAFASLGVGQDELLELLEQGGKTPMSEAQRKIASQIASAEGGVSIPFWMARRMESALNQAAYGGARPIGTITQGKARRLLGQLQDDLHDFYAGPEATTASPAIEGALQAVGGQGDTLAEALPLAKQKYREFIQTANRTVISKLLDPNPVVQEKFLKPFVSGSDQAQLLAVKGAASPEVWDTLGAYVLGELHKKASGGGQFDTRLMADELKKLRRSGRMDVLYTPEQVAAIERYSATLTAGEESYAAGLRKAIQGKEPEKVVDFVFHPGDYSRTQGFRAAVQPDTYDAAVKAWAQKFQDDAQSLSPAQLRNKYGIMTQREKLPGGGAAPSQLDILLTDYPDAADAITEALRSVGSREAAVEAAKARVKELTDVGTPLQNVGVYGGMYSVIHGVLTGNPGAVATGVIGSTAPYLARKWAHSPTGERVIRDGLSNAYGPSNARWVLSALGAAEAPPAQAAPPKAP